MLLKTYIVVLVQVVDPKTSAPDSNKYSQVFAPINPATPVSKIFSMRLLYFSSIINKRLISIKSPSYSNIDRIPLFHKYRQNLSSPIHHDKAARGFPPSTRRSKPNLSFFFGKRLFLNGRRFKLVRTQNYTPAYPKLLQVYH